MLSMCADCDSQKSLLLCEVLAACERYHRLPPYSVAPNASQIAMISDLLDAIACEVRPSVPANDDSDDHITVPGMPYETHSDVNEISSLKSFVDDAQEETVMDAQPASAVEAWRVIYGSDSDVEDEFEDDEPRMPPVSPSIARTKPTRRASTSTLIGIRKSLFAEKDLASITPAHEPKRRRFA